MVNKKTFPKKLPICPFCQKGFFHCIVLVGEDNKSYHLKCLELKEEKYISFEEFFNQPNQTFLSRVEETPLYRLSFNNKQKYKHGKQTN